MPTACLTIPETTSLLLAHSQDPRPPRPHTSVFPLLWQERSVSSLEAHSVACGRSTQTSHSCATHRLGRQLSRSGGDRKLGKKGSGTACRVRVPLTTSMWTWGTAKSPYPETFKEWTSPQPHALPTCLGQGRPGKQLSHAASLHSSVLGPPGPSSLGQPGSRKWSRGTFRTTQS